MPRYKPPKKSSRIKNYQENLTLLKVLPSKEQVFLRYKTLQMENNGMKAIKLLILLSNEIISSWQHQDIPVQQQSNVVKKLKILFAKESYLYHGSFLI